MERDGQIFPLLLCLQVILQVGFLPLNLCQIPMYSMNNITKLPFGMFDRGVARLVAQCILSSLSFSTCGSYFQCHGLASSGNMSLPLLSHWTGFSRIQAKSYRVSNRRELHGFFSRKVSRNVYVPQIGCQE